MNAGRYQYLFPYEKVAQGSDVLIYGAGIMGMEYLKQMLITGYCNVVGMIDKRHQEFPPMKVPVCPSGAIPQLKFEYVVVALRSALWLDEIKEELLGYGVGEDKIICVYEREESIPLDQEEILPPSRTPALAYRQSAISVAILASGGIGDMVIQKRFIEELIRLAPDCRIDIYYSRVEGFLEYLYSGCRNVNAVIPDPGVWYHARHTEYTLGIEMASTRYIHVDSVKKAVLEEHCAELADRVWKLKEESEKEDFTFNTLIYAVNHRRMLQGCNAYTALGYNGAFGIQDKKVDIPLAGEAEKEFRKLRLGEYITVGYGNGTDRRMDRVAKMWPQEYFERTVAMFRKKYPSVQVVQVGGRGQPELKGADRYLLGEKFEVVAHVLRNAIFHLDIEGGLVHIASQLGTKCIVLFGPTPKELYGYEGNINISAGTCQDCTGLYRDPYMCARGMERPECMYSITPELVMDNICSYMDNVYSVTG